MKNRFRQWCDCFMSSLPVRQWWCFSARQFQGDSNYLANFVTEQRCIAWTFTQPGDMLRKRKKMLTHRELRRKGKVFISFYDHFRSQFLLQSFQLAKWIKEQRHDMKGERESETKRELGTWEGGFLFAKLKKIKEFLNWYAMMVMKNEERREREKETLCGKVSLLPAP